MLKSLHVENFALLDKIDVEFEPGLNIITGETGAGKSILIDALGSTIGEKIPMDVLRKGAKKAVTECTFQINQMDELKEYLHRSDIEDFDDTIILRKESSETGRNRAFVNDSPTSNSVLSDIGNLLVDLHGQHEHQSLLKVKHHISYLDAFGGNDELLDQVEGSFNRYIQLVHELKELERQQQTQAEKRELYQFQIQEISSVDPQPDEEAELIQEEKRLGNSEKLYKLSTELIVSLYEDEQSLYDGLSAALGNLEELAEIDNVFETVKADCEAAQVAIQEIAKFLQSYVQKIEFNPQRLETVRERLGQFSALKRKYQRSIEEIVEYKDKISVELQLIENLETAIAEKKNQIKEQRQELTQLCLSLSEKRRVAGEELEKLVLSHLSQLGMKGARFKVNISYSPDEHGAVEIEGERYKTSSLGIDQVEFFISANPGEDLKPLARVASGGEVSRIMLALKSSLARADKIPLLVFDEIDIGISGRIAQAVGRSLKRLSKTHQIICITHLPQIASVGDHHFVVEKVSDENSTRTRIRKLSEEERAEEIAKLLGGESVSETHINSAKELLAEAKRTEINPL